MVKANKNLHRRGSVLLEVVVVIPLILIIVLHLVEFGWLFLKMQDVTVAARQGARIGSRYQSNEAMVNAAVLAALTNANLQTTDYEIILSAAPDSLSPGDPLTVTVRIPYESVGLNMPIFFVPLRPDYVTGRVVMAKQG